MRGAWSEELQLLPGYLSHHLLLSLLALLAGVGASLGLSFASLRWRGLQAPLLFLASTVQTIPALALLALMVPLLGTIGFLPAFLALVLYSMLPVLRNAITGLTEVDPSLVRAGVGLGMTDGQVLWGVRLPLALPVIVAGIRTATVWVVGMATLSTPVGATSLGNFIFGGLQIQNHRAVLLGCVSVAALALALDFTIKRLEVAARERRPRAAVLPGVVLVLGLAFGLAPRLADREGPSFRLGTKTFTEQYVLAELLAERLRAEGVRPEKLESLGSTIAFDALAAGEIDAYVDYTGTLWAVQMGRTENPGAARVLEEVTDWLAAEHGIVCLGALGFENAYAVAVRRELARELGLVSLADLAPHAPGLTIGGDYEFFQRPEWKAVRETYGLAFREETSFDSSLMYVAAAESRVDAISAFSTEGRIDSYDLVVLEDPEEALPPYDAVLLLSHEASARPDVRRALEPLLGAIDVETMRRANLRVDVEGASVGESARALSAELEARVDVDRVEAAR